jgi:hypothetical protein
MMRTRRNNASGTGAQGPGGGLEGMKGWGISPEFRDVGKQPRNAVGIRVPCIEGTPVCQASVIGNDDLEVHGAKLSGVRVELQPM